MRVVVDWGAFPPERAHKQDAGLDLRTPIAFTIKPGQACIVDTGTHVELPAGTYGRLESKSGLHINHGIVCLGGTIDEGYTGSIRVKLHNFGSKEYTFHGGDKIVQLVVIPIVRPEIEFVESLDKTERGDSGFGSTGK